MLFIDTMLFIDSMLFIDIMLFIGLMLFLESILTYDNEGLPDWQATFDSLHLYLSLNIYRLTNRKLIVQTYPSSNSFKTTGEYVGDEEYEIMAITLPKITSLNM
ncbi:SMP3 [Bugula neritina]|uniref:SMP3 n=1 Tax=Bugula neritina TaxID=10212 RepID=A0A7J7IVL7_BUGNE|nr:SMP3 [Bugula neritina]